MKKIILITLIFTLSSCNPQSKGNKNPEGITHNNVTKESVYNKLNNKEMEKFDIEKFNKNKDEAGNYRHKLPNGSLVLEYGGTEYGEYMIDISTPNSFFIINKIFYINGNLKSKGQSFKDNFEIGIWYDYDEKGNLISTVNTDKQFIISFEDIENFSKKNKIDLHSDKTYINRFFDEKTKKCTWTINYIGEYNNDKGFFIIVLDGRTGTILKVTKVVGKEGEKKIIYDADVALKDKQKIFTTHKGKSYTAEEWRRYEEELYQKDKNKKK